ELELESFSQWDALEHREVNVVDRWAPIRISLEIAEGAGRNSEGARIEPTDDGANLIRSPPTLRNRFLTIWIGIRRDWPGDKRIRNQIGPEIVVGRARSTAPQVCQIARDDQIERCSGTRLRNEVSLPVAQHPGRRPTLKPFLPLAKRN